MHVYNVAVSTDFCRGTVNFNRSQIGENLLCKIACRTQLPHSGWFFFLSAEPNIECTCRLLCCEFRQVYDKVGACRTSFVSPRILKDSTRPGKWSTPSSFLKVPRMLEVTNEPIWRSPQSSRLESRDPSALPGDVRAVQELASAQTRNFCTETFLRLFNSISFQPIHTNRFRTTKIISSFISVQLPLDTKFVITFWQPLWKLHG